MSFDEIYYPGFVYDAKDAASVLNDYRDSIFPDGPTEDPAAPADAAQAADEGAAGRTSAHAAGHRPWAGSPGTIW